MFRVAQSKIDGSQISSSQYSADSQYLVQTPTNVLYAVQSAAAGGVQFFKSIDHGLTWSGGVAVSGQMSINSVSVWYDRWSNISAGLIHIAYTSNTTDDTYYRTIDTENSDALSTETTIFLGGSAAGGGSLSVVRAVGGNVYCRTCIDAGAEGGFYRLPNANVPSGAWDAARTVNEALATSDQMILLPDLNAADTQDIYGIFWDLSASEISRQNYDDSANTWAETSISGSMTLTAPSGTAGVLNYAAAVDLTNSQTVLIAWSAVDTLNADLKCWTVNSTSITAKTDVVTNSTDDQGLAAIGIDTDTNYWYAFYVGKTDGSETYPSAVNAYMKISTDSGTTWGAETLITISDYQLNIMKLNCIPRFSDMWCAWIGLRDPASGNYFTTASLSPKIQARPQVMLGV
jgi:hypothetical protein